MNRGLQLGALCAFAFLCQYGQSNEDEAFQTCLSALAQVPQVSFNNDTQQVLRLSLYQQDANAILAYTSPDLVIPQGHKLHDLVRRASKVKVDSQWHGEISIVEGALTGSVDTSRFAHKRKLQSDVRLLRSFVNHPGSPFGKSNDYEELEFSEGRKHLDTELNDIAAGTGESLAHRLNNALMPGLGYIEMSFRGAAPAEAASEVLPLKMLIDKMIRSGVQLPRKKGLISLEKASEIIDAMAHGRGINKKSLAKLKSLHPLLLTFLDMAASALPLYTDDDDSFKLLSPVVREDRLTIKQARKNRKKK